MHTRQLLHKFPLDLALESITGNKEGTCWTRYNTHAAADALQLANIDQNRLAPLSPTVIEKLPNHGSQFFENGLWFGIYSYL